VAAVPIATGNNVVGCFVQTPRSVWFHPPRGWNLQPVIAGRKMTQLRGLFFEHHLADE
jgi:hypothetical protein